MSLYRYTNEPGDHLVIVDADPGAPESGLYVRTSKHFCLVPDDEIPALISALQDYMSKRAKQITRAAGNGR